MVLPAMRHDPAWGQYLAKDQRHVRFAAADPAHDRGDFTDTFARVGISITDGRTEMAAIDWPAGQPTARPESQAPAAPSGQQPKITKDIP
jgi:hypothetical protein